MAGPLGFEPKTFSLEGHPKIDLKAYREYLDEYIDLSQCRILKSVFDRRYLEVEDVKESVKKVMLLLIQ